MAKIKLFAHVHQDTNPGKSGWCVILRYGEHERKLTGTRHGVGPEVALHAIVSAIARIKRPSKLLIYTDRACVKWMSKRYRLADVYEELIDDTLQAIQDGGHEVSWIVKTDDPLARVAAHAAKGAL